MKLFATLRCLILLTLLSTAFYAQTGKVVPLPDTAAGKRMADFLRACNVEDEVQLRDFFANHFATANLEKQSAAQRAGGFQMIKRDLGGSLELRQVLEASEYGITVELQGRNGAWLLYAIKLDEQPPYKINYSRLEKLATPFGKTAAQAGTAVERWKGVAKNTPNGEMPFTMELQNIEGKLSGQINTAQGVLPVTAGKLEADKFSLTITTPDGVPIKISAVIRDKQMLGRWESDTLGKGEFECARLSQ